MKKNIFIFLCTFMCIVGISGCGGSKEIDSSVMAQQLMSSGIFSENLTELSTSIVEKRLAVSADQVESCTAYAGTKAVVDEMIIIKATSSENADMVKAAVDKHIATQKKSYESYRPDEVPKLESAVILKEGNYVILVASNDNKKAQDVVKSCLK